MKMKTETIESNEKIYVKSYAAYTTEAALVLPNIRISWSLHTSQPHARGGCSIRFADHELIRQI